MRLGFNPYSAAHLTARAGQNDSNQAQTGASGKSTKQDNEAPQPAKDKKKVMSFEEARRSPEASTD